ncbi:glycerophosphodiester phosphodiesterase [Brochothrix campestris]|uniref:glycerophosphodiester phosphodiesterase n=1 Tax=Brochothrix campestris TaxID=2757 RepID=UPI0038D1AFA8
MAKVKAILFVFFMAFFLTACTQVKLSNYDSTNPLIISHRGSPLTFPEHSFAGYDDAIVKGTYFIEQDLILSKDNKLVVSHDDNLMRILGVNRNISDSNYLQLSNYRFTNGEQLHLLNDVFERYSNAINYVIETKFNQTNSFHTMERELIALIEKHRLEKNVILQSYSIDSLNFMYEKSKKIPQMLILDEAKSNKLQEALVNVPEHIQIITISSNYLTPTAVKLIHDTGRLAMTYNLDSYDQLNYGTQVKIDGFFTNDTKKAYDKKN